MGRGTDIRQWYYCILLECFRISFLFNSAIHMIKFQIFMTSDDKSEAFDTIDSWCFMFILIIIPYDFILFILILYQF
jgi:hypothetical protein